VRQVNIQEAKTHLSRLVEEARNGEDIVLAKAGKPLVRLVRFETDSSPRTPGAWAGKGWIADDFDAEDERVLALFDCHKPANRRVPKP
jgi:prevent-host-death family protein